ncbi:MAG TPA: hypothetical protein VH397_21010 [Xanthobacteraceae bacterium]
MASLDKNSFGGGLSGTVPTMSRCRKKRRGFSAMLSADYFRRQADICVRLSLIASDDEVSSRLITMAKAYMAKGDALAREAPADAAAAGGGSAGDYDREGRDGPVRS